MPHPFAFFANGWETPRLRHPNRPSSDQVFGQVLRPGRLNIHTAVALALLSLALIPARAQAPPAPPSPVDTALLAKAASGDAAAQLKAGDTYAAGPGVPRDPRQLAADLKEAAAWYLKAANQGNAAAQIRLADFYRDGRGVPRDMAQAVDWYLKAADLGDPTAQGTLGILYSVGMGVGQDYQQAYFWLDLAAQVPGPSQARCITNRQGVGEHLTTTELSLVEDRIAAWKAAHPRPVAPK
ncbi:MAG: tetratricopeptide repeat protein [Terracidiphilus sp.]|nr:tetratricopeptide repeat protein [Terracidiphilus sp.]